MQSTRRQFLQTTGGALAAGTGLGFLANLRPVSAEEAKLPASLVHLDDSIEPAVRLLEETPRERVLEEVGARIKNGMAYRELLAALLLAGVRNVQPRPAVGFKFHAVLVINSAHLASVNSADSDRWLPIFWAIDRFKSAQSETARTSGWRMSQVDEQHVPPGNKAKEAFIAAMDQWDEAAADAAAAGLARFVPRDECFELFARYGCRDFRDIGHKAIYVSNSFRTLSAIGWHHAEPILRSLAYALMKFDGANPSKSDAAPDRPGRHNAELIQKMKPDWQAGKADPAAIAHLFSVFRTASAEDAPAAVVDALNSGVSTRSVWDAILTAAGELLMRKTNIVSLHSVTSANAMQFAFQTAADPQTRLMLLLQNASFLTLFREAIGKMGSTQIDQLESADTEGKISVDDLFAEASRDRMSAARKTLGYLNQTHNAEEMMHAARRLVFLKGNDAHDYKFSSAVLEDFYNVSPDWRNRFLAASMFYLPGSGAKDNELVNRIRAALG